MTAPFNPLAETLALLAEFQRSDWEQCHVRTGTMEVFLSRQPRSTNPMAHFSSEDTRAIDPSELQLLTAPHVGTLRSISAVGEPIQAGFVYAVVEVLDELRELAANCDGTVIDALAREGDFVEHDQPLLSLEVRGPTLG
jgi:biotin carboxyl carrier protein